MFGLGVGVVVVVVAVEAVVVVVVVVVVAVAVVVVVVVQGGPSLGQFIGQKGRNKKQERTYVNTTQMKRTRVQAPPEQPKQAGPESWASRRFEFRLH